jgi:hypothetical protein
MGIANPLILVCRLNGGGPPETSIGITLIGTPGPIVYTFRFAAPEPTRVQDGERFALEFGLKEGEVVLEN